MNRDSMTIKELIEIISSDLHRYESKVNFKCFLRYLFFTPGFKYSYRMRIYRFISDKRYLNILKPLMKLSLKRLTYKYGIQIPMETNIGEGLLITHFGGIFINPESKIGKNFTICQDVTIGINKGGVPTIGDNVYVAAGAKVIGDINVGNNSIIGVNSVVTKKVPDNAVVAGNPMRILYYKI